MSDNQHPLDVRVSGLRKTYGGLQALGGVTFCIRRGEIFGYLGPNGAGKTTTINLLCGLLGRDAGDVAICGLDVEREPVGVKQQIGVVPEDVIEIEDRENERLTWVKGLQAAFLQCYDQGILPAEHGGIPWAREGRLIDLREYRSYPLQA